MRYHGSIISVEHFPDHEYAHGGITQMAMRVGMSGDDEKAEQAKEILSEDDPGYLSTDQDAEIRSWFNIL